MSGPLIDQWCSGCGEQLHEGEPLHKRTDPGHSAARAAPSVTQRMQDEFNADVRARRAAAPPVEPRPSPHSLWQQAKGDSAEYRRLMVEHGHLVPKTTLGRAFCPHGVAYDCASCLAARAAAPSVEPHDCAAARERDDLRAAAEDVLKSADPDDDFDGQYIAYLVDFAAIEALRAALHREDGA